LGKARAEAPSEVLSEAADDAMGDRAMMQWVIHAMGDRATMEWGAECNATVEALSVAVAQQSRQRCDRSHSCAIGASTI
jgi:hypothetical protein